MQQLQQQQLLSHAEVHTERIPMIRSGCTHKYAILTQLIRIALVRIERLQLPIRECLQFLIAIAEQIVLALVYR